MRLPLAFCALALLTLPLRGQTAGAVPPSPAPATAAPPAPAMLSSRAAYDEAMHPLELTRRDIGNWSDAELAALNLAIQQAASACGLRDALHVPVDELVDLARLCGVGQNWEVTMMAAHRYIDSTQADKPQLTQAYADAAEAELRLKMGSAARVTTQEMLAKVPYDAVASGAYNLALDYLQFVDTPGALALANTAQPLLLDRLKALTNAALGGTPAENTTVSAASSTVPVAPAHTVPADPAALTSAQVYRDALRLPALEIYLGRFSEAAVLATAVEQLVPAQLGGDDALLIAAERRRFALLGHRLPLVDVALSLDPGHAPAQELPLSGLTNALLLFPDWCAQCVRMGAQFPEGKFTVGGRAAAFYALLAQTRPSSPPPSVQGTGQGSGTPKPRTALEQLRGTPTLLVPAATLLQLEATDYPLLVLVDEKGIVRLHQAVGEDALQSGSTMDTAIAGLPSTGKTAPTPPPGPSPAPPLPQ